MTTNFNPSDLSGVSLSSDYLTATGNVGSWGSGARATTPVTTGKRYWRTQWTLAGGSYAGAAACASGEPLAALMGGADGWVAQAQVGATGSVWHLTGSIGSFPTFANNGDWIVIAYDVDAGLLFFTTMTAAGVLDTNWNSVGANPATGSGGFSTSSASGALYPAANFFDADDTALLDANTVIPDATLYGFLPIGRIGVRISSAGSVVIAGTSAATIGAVTAQAAGISGTVAAPAHDSPAVPWWWAAYVARHEAEREAARLKWLVENTNEGDGFAVLTAPAAHGQATHDPDEQDMPALAAASLWLLAA